MTERLDKVRESFKESNIDALLVTTPFNIRYLAYFTGTTAYLLITKDKAYFITDFRYAQQAADQAQDFEIRIVDKNYFEEVNLLVKETGVKHLGFEADHMTVSLYMYISDMVDLDLIETKGLVEKIREIKDPEEIEIIKEACEITDQAFEHILDYIKPGETREVDVANELDHFLKLKGASGMSFDTIVASGLRSAMPHGVASEKVIEEGDMVTIDFGCYYHGYVSDMTRTFAVGEVDPKLEEIYQIVWDAHEKVTAEAKVGMTGKEIDAIARDYIADKGYGDNFGHSTGHGIGLDIHEGPAISKRNNQPVQVNNVITNEPGIYLPGVGGVRIEDDLIVTEEGMVPINRSPKHLIKI